MSFYKISLFLKSEISKTVSNLVLGYCCTMFDEGVGRVVEDFSRPCSDCSFKYPSDESVKCKVFKDLYLIFRIILERH